MIFFIFKAVVSGVLIALISSLAKSYPRWAALLTALPLMTYLSLFWIYFENKDLNLLANYTRDVFWWILPSLIFFLIAIFLFRSQINFFVSIGISTMGLFLAVWLFLKTGLIK